ncbi:MAG: AI-2E family transporter [Polyangiales bacterium]
MGVEPSNDADVVRHEHLALAVAAIASIAVILWLAKPIGMGVLLGVLFAFTFRPTYERIARRYASRAAALTTVLGSALGLALTFAGLVWILVSGGVVLARQAIDSLEAGGGTQRIVVAVARVTSRVGISSTELDAKTQSFAQGAAALGAALAQQIAAATASMLLSLFFAMLTMYFILRRWDSIGRALIDTLPLRPEYTRKLLQEFRRVGRMTLLSVGVIGLLQGVLATVGYWIVGLPQPLFLGALTAIASLAPGVGTLLVWLPAGIALALLGHVGGGVFLVAWGIVVLTGVPTYVISPRLVGGAGDSSMPALFSFISLFGGAALWGLKGLIVGPVLMAVAIAVLRLYAQEAHDRRHVGVS